MTEIDTLTTAHFTGEIDSVGSERLGRWIAESPDHARRFALDALVDRSLREARRDLRIGAAPSAQPVPGLRLVSDGPRGASSPSSPSPLRWLSIGRLTAAAAATLLIAALLRFGGSAPVYAVIVASVDAAWARGIVPSERLTQGQTLTLEAGLVQLRTASGAVVVLEGPVVAALASLNAIDLTSGKLSALCRGKESHGFTVRTPEGRVVDLGTEFGVERHGGGTRVHVLEGEVQVFPHKETGWLGRVLREGEALSIGAGSDEAAATDSWAPAFRTASDFRVALARGDGSVPPSWEPIYAELRSDPDLVFWSDFNNEDTLGSPDNLSRYSDGRTRLLAADKISKLSPGRVASNEALDCGPGAVAPVLRTPGVFRGLSLAAWVRLDEVATERRDKHRGLLLSDWSSPGSVHWQVKDDELRLSYPLPSSSEGGPGQAVHAARLPPTPGATAWRLLVTVVEPAPVSEVRHYVDGRIVGRSPVIRSAPMLRLGDCGVGGWYHPGDERPLDGAIDDLMVWRRPLSGSEARRLWEDGQAPR